MSQFTLEQHVFTTQPVDTNKQNLCDLHIALKEPARLRVLVGYNSPNIEQRILDALKKNNNGLSIMGKLGFKDSNISSIVRGQKVVESINDLCSNESIKALKQIVKIFKPSQISSILTTSVVNILENLNSLVNNLPLLRNIIKDEHFPINLCDLIKILQQGRDKIDETCKYLYENKKEVYTKIQNAGVSADDDMYMVAMNIAIEVTLVKSIVNDPLDPIAPKPQSHIRKSKDLTWHLEGYKPKKSKTDVNTEAGNVSKDNVKPQMPLGLKYLADIASEELMKVNGLEDNVFELETSYFNEELLYLGNILELEEPYHADNESDL